MFYDYLTLIGHAALMTLGLAICSLIVGLLLSIIFTALEANKYVFIAKPASVVIALLRGLPEILVVLLIYFGSTQVVEMLTGEYIEFSAFGCGVFALSLIFASYASQTLRGAIQAIPKGQWESGAALGLSRPYTLGLSNQWLVLLKDTALVSLIGVDDLMRQAGYINTNTHEPFTWYGIAALIYLVITLISQAGIRKLELRFTRFERGVE
ncbi:MAG: arginine ABC transporter permease ArtQ [Haemophilus parainfluenzae]|nr:arginine ABC transporter permease ArtQ [Haemophilus parainfluenzae]